MPAAISTGVALFLLWLFAVAAIHKFRTPDYYLRLVRAYVPAGWGARQLVRLAALSEAGVALALLIPGWRRMGLGSAAILLTAYAAMMAWQYGRGRGDLQCGCAGPSSTLTVGPALIIRNLTCVVFALLAMASTATSPLNLGSASLALATGSFMIIVYLFSDQMIANAQAMAGEI